MKQVSTYDAKSRLSQLLDEVEAGESIEIMRRGKPVARLIPSPKPKFESAGEAAEWLRRHRVQLKGLSIRHLIDEGRR